LSDTVRIDFGSFVGKWNWRTLQILVATLLEQGRQLVERPRTRAITSELELVQIRAGFE
jgi:hypothetical protein